MSTRRHAATVAGSARRDRLAVVGVAAVTFAFYLWWWYRNHEGVPWFIDEAGYLAYAIEHAQAARDSGVGGWFRSVWDQAPYAPLVPASSSLLLLVVDDPFLVAAVSMAAWAAALVVATWFLGSTVLPHRWALGTAAVVAGLPTVLVLSGTYYFAVPAAACTAAGLACLVRSDWGVRLGWSAAAGVLFGAALLARTMVAGLLLGVVAAAAVVILTERTERGRRIRGLGVTAAGALLVAAPWYLAGLDAVADHLRAPAPGNGGARGSNSGGAIRIKGMRDLRLLIGDLLVPMAMLGAAVVVLAIARWRRGPRPTPTPARLGVVVAVMAVVLVVASEAAGQWLPVVPIAAVLAASVVAASSVAVQRGFIAVVAVITIGNVVHASRLLDFRERPLAVDAGPLGRLFVADRRTLLEDQLTSLSGVKADELRPVQEFIDFVVTETHAAASRAGEAPVLLVTGGADALLNTNVFVLTDEVLFDGDLVVGAFPLEEISDDELEARLVDPAFGQPNAILTVEPSPRAGPERAEAHDQLVAMLPRVGFEAAGDHVLPDGRRATLWFRSRADIPPVAMSG